MTTRENFLNLAKHAALSLISIGLAAAGHAIFQAALGWVTGPGFASWVQHNAPAAGIMVLGPALHALQVGLINHFTKVVPSATVVSLRDWQ